MFDTVCSIPLSYELFDQAIHPFEPIVSVGLASGHVLTYRLPPAGSDGDVKAIASETGFGQIETLWTTRRHKGSCRTLTFGVDGRHLYSAGTDGIAKAADVATGQVTAKIAIPRDALTNALDHPTVLHTLSPQSLILATDSSAVHIYDLRELAPTASPRPQQTYHPHDDYISSITPLTPSEASTSGFPKQWVSTGGTTLAITDIRRGVMAKSEDQGEELLSSTIVTGLPKRGTNVGEKVIIGGNTGILTLWERGVWDDQDERIKIDPDESIDSLTVFPEGVGSGGKMVAVGLGNGALSFAKIGPNQVVAELKHDDFQSEAVVGLGFDVTGRLISGGGKIVKVWHEKLETDGDGDSEEEQDSDEDSSSDDDEDSDEEDDKKKRRRKGKKRSHIGPMNHAFNDLEGPPSEAAGAPAGAIKKSKGKAQKGGKRR